MGTRPGLCAGPQSWVHLLVTTTGFMVCCDIDIKIHDAGYYSMNNISYIINAYFPKLFQFLCLPECTSGAPQRSGAQLAPMLHLRPGDTKAFAPRPSTGLTCKRRPQRLRKSWQIWILMDIPRKLIGVDSFHTVIIHDISWLLMIIDDYWWLLMIIDDYWWLLTIIKWLFDDYWWLLIVISNFKKVAP